MKKLQGRAGRIKPAVPLLVLVIGIAAAIPLRLYQMLQIVEPETGFYRVRNASVPVLYTLLIVAALLLMILGFLSSNHPADAPRGKKKALGGIALVFALTLLVDSAMQARNFFVDVFSYDAITLTQQSRLQYLIMQGSIPLILQAAFALAACIYFALFAFHCLGFGQDYSQYKILAIAPLAWAIARIVHRFMRTINFRNVSELLFELFMLAAMLLFFMAFARVCSKVNREGAMWRVYAFGYPSVLMALLVSVPRLVLILIGKSALLVSQSPFEACDLAAAAFILCFLLTADRRSGKKKPAQPAYTQDDFSLDI